MKLYPCPVLCFLIGLVLFSCKDDDENLIVEPAGSAHYFINNHSDYDLSIAFITSSELGMEKDSSYSANSQSSVKILEDGIIGVNPVPTNSFKTIRLYAMVEGEIKLVYTLDPVVNEKWIIIDQDLEKSGYGLTIYELIVENSDLDLD